MKKITESLRSRSNISIAEVGCGDLRQRSLLACAAVNTDVRHANASLDMIMDAIEENPDVSVGDYRLKIMNFNEGLEK